MLVMWVAHSVKFSFVLELGSTKAFCLSLFTTFKGTLVYIFSITFAKICACLISTRWVSRFDWTNEITINHRHFLSLQTILSSCKVLLSVMVFFNIALIKLRLCVMIAFNPGWSLLNFWCESVGTCWEVFSLHRGCGAEIQVLFLIHPHISLWAAGDSFQLSCALWQSLVTKAFLV